MRKVDEIKKEVLRLIEKNIDQETFNGETEDIRVFWHRTVCIINEGTEDQIVDISVDEDMSYDDAVKSMSEKHNYPKDKIEFYYEGSIVDKKRGMCLEYFDGIIGYKNMMEGIKYFIESESFDNEMEKSNFKQGLYKEYAVDEIWRDKNKEYKDERYVAIVRTKVNEDWYFDELFDYLEENNQKDVYKIYQAREETKVMYISKSKLRDIKETKVSAKIKDYIQNILDRKENCELCGNTTYVNTQPYVYDGNQCIGRLYACPLCLDLHDLEMSPNYNYRKQLNGEEKMDMYDFVYDKVIKYHKQG